MDEADLAESNSEFIARINRYESLKEEPIAIATGYCLFCDEPLEAGRRWCNVDCRNDWEKC